jgi:hypothetical protein
VAGSRTAEDGTYTFTLPLRPGTYFFRVLSTAEARLSPSISSVTRLVVPAPPPTPAAVPTWAYQNHYGCTWLQRYYPSGVGRVGAVDRTNGTPVTAWRRDTAAYNRAMSFNRDLDGDRDGIACEQR